MSAEAMLSFISELPSYGGPAHCLPNCSAVYFVLDKRACVRYVGATILLRDRWKVQRHRFRDIEHIRDCRVAWVKVRPENLREVEYQFLRKLMPSNNRDKAHRYPRKPNGNGHK